MIFATTRLVSVRITDTLSSLGLTVQTSLPSRDIAIGLDALGPEGVTFTGGTAGAAVAAVAPAASSAAAPRTAAGAHRRTRTPTRARISTPSVVTIGANL